MMQNKFVRALLVLIAIIVLLIAGASFMWVQNASQPDETALAALNSTADVTVSEKDGMYIFTPSNPSEKIGYIFYPGGGVDYRAYSPIMARIAAEGYLAILPSVRFNLAFFDLNRAGPIIEAYPEIDRWVISGHSLGGVAAASFVAENPDNIAGLMLQASQAANDALKDSDLPVVSIYGTLDGLMTVEDIEATKSDLPTDTIYVPIEGGNHAQFGSYGPQSGDSPATISQEEQWDQIVSVTVEFLDQLNEQE